MLTSSIRELFYHYFLYYSRLLFLWKQNLFQKSVGHMTWKSLRKKQNIFSLNKFPAIQHEALGGELTVLLLLTLGEPQ